MAGRTVFLASSCLLLWSGCSGQPVGKPAKDTKVPDENGRIGYTSHALAWSDEGLSMVDDNIERAVESNRMATFHAPQNFGMWRNLATSLSKLAKHYMVDDDNANGDKMAKAAMQEAHAAFRIAAFLGDSTSLDGHALLKDEVYGSYFGDESCIDGLDKSCERMDIETEALELLTNLTTAYDAIEIACSGLKSITVKLSKKELATGRISAANLHRGLMSLKICGVLVIDNAYAGTEHMLDFINNNYVNTKHSDLEVQNGKGGVAKVGPSFWQLTLPMQMPFTDDAILSNPFVLPYLKASMRTAGVEIDTFANSLNFPGKTFQDWKRDLVDPWRPPATDDTVPSNNVPQGIVMMAPLTAQKMKQGPEEFALGSHMGVEMFGAEDEKHYVHLPRTKVPLKKGAVCLFDVRMFHRSTPNKDSTVHQKLYFTFVQDWFTDHQIDKQSMARDFDYLPTVVHQKLLFRQGAKQYIHELEALAKKNGIDVQKLRSEYNFERTALTT